MRWRVNAVQATARSIEKMKRHRGGRERQHFTSSATQPLCKWGTNPESRSIQGGGLWERVKQIPGCLPFGKGGKGKGIEETSKQPGSLPSSLEGWERHPQRVAVTPLQGNCVAGRRCFGSHPLYYYRHPLDCSRCVTASPHAHHLLLSHVHCQPYPFATWPVELPDKWCLDFAPVLLLQPGQEWRAFKKRLWQVMWQGGGASFVASLHPHCFLCIGFLPLSHMGPLHPHMQHIESWSYSAASSKPLCCSFKWKRSWTAFTCMAAPTPLPSVICLPHAPATAMSTGCHGAPDITVNSLSNFPRDRRLPLRRWRMWTENTDERE